MITPQQEVPQLAKALGLSVPLYLKREDLHQYGSHKGRSIPIMIEQYAKGGATRFAISSSGNAALAALMYINEYNQKFTEGPLNLQIYVGENISDEKYQTLSHFAQKNDLASRDVISITKTDRPKQTVHMLDKRGEAISLRKDKVSQVIKESGGSGWVIGNDLIRKSIDLLKEYAGLEASANAVLSIASITKATENGWEQTGSIVAIITGR